MSFMPGPSFGHDLTPTQHNSAYGSSVNYLKGVENLPKCFSSAYEGSFRYFNSVQSECFNDLFHSDSSMVIAAPTASGKTVLLELAILRLFSPRIHSSGNFEPPHGSRKALYLAPSKALVQEKVAEWTARFGRLGITIKELTGDTDFENLSNIDSTDIIAITPEKFDSMTRKHRNRGGMRFFNEIGLVLLDEVHLLSEDRGSVLEAGVVSRIKLVAKKPEMARHPIASVRYIAVSATIPNAQDLGQWINAPQHCIKVFGEETRPVKLHTVVKGYQATSKEFFFDTKLDDYVYSILNEYSQGKPSLIFCPSRKSVSTTAQRISREATQAAAGSRPSMLIKDPGHYNILVKAAHPIADTSLKQCILAGVGFHHAALSSADRAVIESLFRSGHLLVLCTTSTLAVGVNLPAYLVIIKGTRRYAGSDSSEPGGYEEYERSSCLQMVGRAGRPQFDTEGCAVIMTDRANTIRYEQLLHSSENVESTLRSTLAEFLNAEIVLGTIGDISTAIDWIKSTYYYIRVRKNPRQYGVPSTVNDLEVWLRDRVLLATLKELSQHKLISFNEDGFSFQSLPPGVIMAEYYVKLPTMIEMMKCPAPSSMSDLLWIIARCFELSSIKLRRSEKKKLNAVNKCQDVKYHVMGTGNKKDRISDRISTNADKIFVLLNYILADPLDEKLDYSLVQDAQRAITIGSRLSHAMLKYFIHEHRTLEAFNSALLSKSLHHKLWTDSSYETKQVAGIGDVIAERLYKSGGISTLKQLMNADARLIESLCQKTFPWGDTIHSKLKSVLPPEIHVMCEVIGWTHDQCIELKITLERKEEKEQEKDNSTGTGAGTGTDVIQETLTHASTSSSNKYRSPARLFIGSLHDNYLMSTQEIYLDSFPSPVSFNVRTKSCAGVGNAVQIVTSVVHEKLIGVDVAIKTLVPVNRTAYPYSEDTTTNINTTTNITTTTTTTAAVMTDENVQITRNNKKTNTATKTIQQQHDEDENEDDLPLSSPQTTPITDNGLNLNNTNNNNNNNNTTIKAAKRARLSVKPKLTMKKQVKKEDAAHAFMQRKMSQAMTPMNNTRVTPRTSPPLSINKKAHTLLSLDNNDLKESENAGMKPSHAEDISPLLGKFAFKRANTFHFRSPTNAKSTMMKSATQSTPLSALQMNWLTSATNNNNNNSIDNSMHVENHGIENHPPMKIPALDSMNAIAHVNENTTASTTATATIKEDALDISAALGFI